MYSLIAPAAVQRRAAAVYGARFQQDHTLTLTYRLCTNVIKTAIRSLSVSYSRICLEAHKRISKIVAKFYFLFLYQFV